jgi:hypothetical protein
MTMYSAEPFRFSILIAGVAAVACLRRRFGPLLIGMGLATLTFLTPVMTLSAAKSECREHYYESTECVEYR